MTCAIISRKDFIMEKLNVAVFFGGCSPEYSVSLSSASGVILNLDREKYNPVLIGITQKGSWYHYTGSVDKLLNDTWHNSQDCVPAVLSPNRGEKRLLLLKEEGVESINDETGKRMTVSYDKLVRLVETPQVYALYTAGQLFMLVFKDQLSESQREEFRAFLRTKPTQIKKL